MHPWNWQSKKQTPSELVWLRQTSCSTFLLPEADLLPHLSKTLPHFIALLWLVLVSPQSSSQGRSLIWSCTAKASHLGEGRRWNPASARSSFVFICDIDHSVSISSFITIWHFTGDRHAPPVKCLLGLHRFLHTAKCSALGAQQTQAHVSKISIPKSPFISQFMLKFIPWHRAEHSSHSWVPGQTCWETVLLSFHFVLKSKSEKNCKIPPRQIRPSL